MNWDSVDTFEPKNVWISFFECHLWIVCVWVCTENVWGPSQLLIRHHSQGHLKIPFNFFLFQLVQNARCTGTRSADIWTTNIPSKCSVKSKVWSLPIGENISSIGKLKLFDPNLMLMYFACYFPPIVLILAKTSLLSTIATIGHVTEWKQVH